jgi:3',5'-cyclic AMP phosphodiesterase CpdA
VTATLQQAIAKINALRPTPEFVLHTGDLSHSQKPGAFDTLAENLKGLKTRQVFYVPGEHDVFADGGKEYLNRFGAGTKGGGWQSFDYKGVHFVGLANVLTFKESKLGSLGPDQLDWLKQDLAGLSGSTPVVVFAHVPLWAVYPQWGWATGDGEQALALLRRFGSVTVLNGHIHQVMQKVEGNITFHTAMSTAFPQPPPGGAPSPGPWKQVSEDRVKTMLGLTQLNYVERKGPLAIVDSTLG